MASPRHGSVVPLQIIDVWLSGFSPGFTMESEANLGIYIKRKGIYLFGYSSDKT